MFRHLVGLDKVQLNTLFELKDELVELQSDSEDDEESYQPAINVLSYILVDAIHDGWTAPDGRR